MGTRCQNLQNLRLQKKVNRYKLKVAMEPFGVPHGAD